MEGKPVFFFFFSEVQVLPRVVWWVLGCSCARQRQRWVNARRVGLLACWNRQDCVERIGGWKEHQLGKRWRNAIGVASRGTVKNCLDLQMEGDSSKEADVNGWT